jgi:DNA modification methylase
MERPVRNHLADTVYEPFAGSGTTLIACERTGRACIAMELDPGYCDVVVRRWEEFTGRKAERVQAEGVA